MKKTLIVGAGLAGCTVARVLPEKGFSVSLIEKRSHIGGSAPTKKLPGYYRYRLRFPFIPPR